MSANTKLQTTLDKLPYGDENLSDDLKVTKQLPEGVKSKELYRHIRRLERRHWLQLALLLSQNFF